MADGAAAGGLLTLRASQRQQVAQVIALADRADVAGVLFLCPCGDAAGQPQPDFRVQLGDVQAFEPFKVNIRGVCVRGAFGTSGKDDGAACANWATWPNCTRWKTWTRFTNPAPSSFPVVINGRINGGIVLRGFKPHAHKVGKLLDLA